MVKPQTTQIKIISNPYERTIVYCEYDRENDRWVDIRHIEARKDSSLHMAGDKKFFFPFKVREIVEIIHREYGGTRKKVVIAFEGTKDEYDELECVCNSEGIRDTVRLQPYPKQRYLKNARDVFQEVKSVYSSVKSDIEGVAEDPDSKKELNKISDTLEEKVPICVFGNYSAGKSTFINALIGHEILPSGEDPITAKIFEIQKSGEDNIAIISFEYRNEKYRLQFKDCDLEIIEGNKESDIVEGLNPEIDKIEDKNLFTMVNTAVSYLNDVEQSDPETLISNVIKIVVPFSREFGVLGKSTKKFVIFDTPGSNSESYKAHRKVLEKYLDDFSNGIPIWVTEYNSLDSTDNADLCEELGKIDALDKRFTMIVINKVDEKTLPKEVKETEENVMDKVAVRDMYAGGIFFVSSVMALGAKNNGMFVDDHCNEVYEGAVEKFRDRNHKRYKRLYRYNIIPSERERELIKAESEDEDENELIFKNSGLQMVENTIEQFASNYSVYSKCKMVYDSLRNNIEERISDKIEENESNLKKTLDGLKKELKKEEEDLLEKIDEESESFLEGLNDDLLNKLVECIHTPPKTTGELTEVVDVSKSNQSDDGTDRLKKDIDGIRRKLSRYFKFDIESFRKIFAIIPSEVGKLITDYNKFRRDRNMHVTEESERFLNSIDEYFKEEIKTAQDNLNEDSLNQWNEKAKEYLSMIKGLISASDDLPDNRKEELSSTVENFAEDIYGGNNTVFKSDELSYPWYRRYTWDWLMGEENKLNLELLTENYNSMVPSMVRDLAERINSNNYNIFCEWQKKLKQELREKLVDYNPELKDINCRIRAQEKAISSYEKTKQKIMRAFKDITAMTGWIETE